MEYMKFSDYAIFNTITSDLDLYPNDTIKETFIEAIKDMVHKDIEELKKQKYLESEILIQLKKKYKNICDIKEIE